MSKIAQDAEGAVFNQQVSLLSDLYRHLMCKYTIIIFKYFNDLRSTTGITKDWSEVIADSVVEASFKCNASCIIVLTRSGSSAQLIAKYRPRCPIYAITRFEQVSQFQPYWCSCEFGGKMVFRLPDNVCCTEIFIQSFTKKKLLHNGTKILTTESNTFSSLVLTVAKSRE